MFSKTPVKLSGALVAVWIALVAGTPLLAQGKNRPWTIDDVLLADRIEEWQVAPDGEAAVWVRSSVDTERQQRLSNLVLTRFADGGEPTETPLTRGRPGAFSPRWSPDGKRVAFLSGRPDPAGAGTEGNQIWLLDLGRGGEAYPLTAEKRPIRELAWGSADRLYFTMQELPSPGEMRRSEEKDATIVVDDEEHEPPVRLFQLALPSRQVTRLTDNADRITSISVSPDGNRVVAIHDRSLRYLYDQKMKPAVYLYDFVRGVRERLFEERGYNLRATQWAADGSGFYAVSAHTTDPEFVYATVLHLHFYDRESGRVLPVNLDWERGLAGGLTITHDGFVALLADGARNRAARFVKNVDTDGRIVWTKQWLVGDHAANLFDVATTPLKGNTLLYYYATASRPGQWYRANLVNNALTAPAALTAVNTERWRGHPPARSEVIRWKGAGGDEIEGILYYPIGYEAGRKYPLVVMVHGGPAFADCDTFSEDWFYPAQLFCQRGAFVLKPNYHGSIGYGLPFAESIAGGKYYELPAIDIERGIDHLVEQGRVDRAKLGVMGWSNGAILALSLIARSTQYRAASSGAGGVEWTADWAACAFGHSFNRYYLGKTPLEDPRRYRQLGPFYEFEKVRTPLLIFHGTEDRSVPTHHGWMQYRALQQIGKAPVRFLLFPGEGHVPQKLAHQRRKLTEELAWFDRYLFGTSRPAREAIKPGSPLDGLLKRRSVAQDVRGRYGMLAPSGALLPETVKRGALELGRFEVTRAQFAAFDPAYPVPPGTDNFPASGITLEQAKAYCQWLSRQSAGTYRLPSEEELAPWMGDPSAAENTLDWWAGYPVGPEDAGRLLAEVKTMGSRDVPALLRMVGSFPGVGEDGEELLFDLKGNVAEWSIGREGSGKVIGGSADTAVDARIRMRQPGPEYIGLRVVHSLAVPPLSSATRPAPTNPRPPVSATTPTPAPRPETPTPPRPAPSREQELPDEPAQLAALSVGEPGVLPAHGRGGWDNGLHGEVYLVRGNTGRPRLVSPDAVSLPMPRQEPRIPLSSTPERGGGAPRTENTVRPAPASSPRTGKRLGSKRRSRRGASWRRSRAGRRRQGRSTRRRAMQAPAKKPTTLRRR